MGLRVWSGGEIFSKKIKTHRGGGHIRPPPIITQVKLIVLEYPEAGTKVHIFYSTYLGTNGLQGTALGDCLFFPLSLVMGSSAFCLCRGPQNDNFTDFKAFTAILWPRHGGALQRF